MYRPGLISGPAEGLGLSWTSALRLASASLRWQGTHLRRRRAWRAGCQWAHKEGVRPVAREGQDRIDVVVVQVAVLQPARQHTASQRATTRRWEHHRLGAGTVSKTYGIVDRRQHEVVDDVCHELELANHVQHLLKDWKHLHTHQQDIRALVLKSPAWVSYACSLYLSQSAVAWRDNLVVDIFSHAAPGHRHTSGSAKHVCGQGSQKAQWHPEGKAVLTL